MSINPKLWISAMTVTLLASLWLILGKPVQVAAAPLANSSSNSCLTCHEDRYYLHDTGRYYCMTERADRCVNCHQGNPAAIDEAASHLGLIAHPQENNGEKCLQCHAQDVQVRLEKLASAADNKTVVQTIPYTLTKDSTGTFPVTSGSTPFIENVSWLAGAITLFGLWLLLVMISPLKP
jgi:hypothetical protein